MFVDEAVVHLRAGHGGNGCAGFRREKFLPKGGPSGGDGGKGGDVVLIGDENTGDLTTFRYSPNLHARDGEPGRGRDQYGHAGSDLEVLLPLGTIVTDAATERVVAEITEHKQRVVLLRGGAGGLGKFTPGKPGDEGDFQLVLKTIADIGLVGFPNAGKSSLTNALTRAHSKIAPYPFTTRHAHVGVIAYPETHDTLRLADIPGLIAGASENRGLGHEFLRHIERCRLLLLLLDMAGADARDPLEDYRDLLDELERYDPALLEKPRIIAANKMDEPVAAENFKRFRKKHKQVPILKISCLTGEGLDELKIKLRDGVRVPAA
jgi:GTP-binding protein